MDGLSRTAITAKETPALRLGGRETNGEGILETTKGPFFGDSPSSDSGRAESSMALRPRVGGGQRKEVEGLQASTAPFGATGGRQGLR